MAQFPTRLYLITPPDIDPAAFSPRLDEALSAGDVACVQLRLKGVSDDAIRRATQVLMPVVHGHDTAFLMNDRADLAKELDCDGVHIGQEDGTLADARRLVGRDCIVGVTCHASRDLAFEAAEGGADYVAFGAFFPSTTKPDPKGHATAQLIADWSSHVTVPCVAIGGITPENCGALVAAGADFLAVSGAVWNHPQGPAAAVKAFAAAIKANTPV
ncbi:MAG: thiamine phosphate synthase [Alphaproteobacteria bacterium]|nr:thiamine phosphate synthase [Alphaproteobacteria bacterium]